MTTMCRCYVLNVGQGSATFVVVYDKSSGAWRPITAVLADLGSGSFNSASEAYAPTVDIIANELKKIPTGAKLDLLVLSHSDNDHINMVAQLLQRFSPHGTGGKPKLTIGKCVFGGWYGLYRKGSANILDDVATYMPGGGAFDTTATAAPAASSGFAPQLLAKMKETRLIDVNGLSVTALLMNAPRPGAGKGSFTKDIEINTRSAVLLATYTDAKGNWANFVITGDATGPTFYETNWRVFALLGKDIEKRMDGTCLMTTPHHGSTRTATCFVPPFTGKPDDEAKWEPIDLFIKNCKAFSTVASAGNTSHRHPRWSLLNRYFGSASTLVDGYYNDPKLPSGAGHLYTAYFDGAEADVALGTSSNATSYRCFATDPALFTTFYFYPNSYGRAVFPRKSGGVTMPTKEALEKAKTAVLVYWYFDVDESDVVTVTPVPFTTSGSKQLLAAPFVMHHPLSLLVRARSALGAARSPRPLTHSAAFAPTRLARARVVA